MYYLFKKQVIQAAALVIVLFMASGCGDSGSSSDSDAELVDVQVDEHSIHSRVVKKTGQIQTHNDFDDGFYQKGVHRNYTRGNDIVIDHATGLHWQDFTPGFGQDNSGTTNRQEAIEYCENLSHGGYTDWRLPVIEELQTIVDLGRFNPAIDSVFESTPSSRCWSSTVFGTDPKYAWNVDFMFGGIYFNPNEYNYCVRCVRAEALHLADFSRDDTSGIVTDNTTNLMWQDSQMEAQTEWSNARDRCESLVLGGYSDWRLPNRNELLSIVDYFRAHPVTHDTFENTRLSGYWSSTISASNLSNAWEVSFQRGTSTQLSRDMRRFVRCVRGGQ